MKKIIIAMIFVFLSIPMLSSAKNIFVKLEIGSLLSGTGNYDTIDSSGDFTSSETTIPSYFSAGVYGKTKEDENFFFGGSFDYMKFKDKDAWIEADVAAGFLYADGLFFSNKESLSGVFGSIGIGIGYVSFPDDEGYLAGSIKIGAGVAIGSENMAILFGMNFVMAGSLLGRGEEDEVESYDDFVDGGFFALNAYVSVMF